MAEQKPIELSNTYLYISGVSVIGLVISGYLLHDKFKKPEQNLIDVPPPSNVSDLSTKIEPKRYFRNVLKISIAYIYMVENYMKVLKKMFIMAQSLVL